MAITVTAAADTKAYDGTTSPRRPRRRSPAAAWPPATRPPSPRASTTRTRARGKTLTPAGSVSDGNGGDNYRVTFVTVTTGSITPRAITVTAATSTKGYDGTTPRRPRRRSPAAAWPRGDTAAFTETFDNKNAGSGKTLTPAGSVSDGNGGNNYAVTFVDNDHRLDHAAGDHRHRGHRHQDLRRHDVIAAAAPTITGGSLATGDTAAFTETFDNKNVGSGKTLTPAGSVNDGNGGNNYAVTFVNGTTGSIDPLAITVTAATDTKVYDGTTVLDGHADDHRRQHGHRRHGRLHRDLRQQERGQRQDAHAGRLGQRRQRRQQLHA